MCPSISAPPGFWAALLIHPLGAWLVLVGMSAAFLAGGRQFVHGVPPHDRRRVALLHTALFICVVCGFAFMVGVAIPWKGAIEGWYNTQWDRLVAHGCSSSIIGLDAIASRARAGADAVFYVGFAISMFAIPLGVARGVIYRQHREQHVTSG
jgi:hypothetical protein